MINPASRGRKNYYKHRNAELSLREDRANLGEREIITMTTMLRTIEDRTSLEQRMIIDLGCGDQYIKNAIEKRGGDYKGLDINECNLEINPFPVENESQDITISLAVIEHLQDPSHFLAETFRVLKEGGILWMSTPDIKAIGAKFWDDPTHVHPYTRISLKKLLEINGFTNISITPNYRCKPLSMYKDRRLNFFRARYLMPFNGTTKLKVPDCLKGHCTGLFALAQKPRKLE